MDRSSGFINKARTPMACVRWGCQKHAKGSGVIGAATPGTFFRCVILPPIKAIPTQRHPKTLRSDKEGRVAAMEIMICNPAIRNAIRENKIEQIISIIQTSSRQGMQLLDTHLLELLDKGIISRSHAREKAFEKHRFN